MAGDQIIPILLVTVIKIVIENYNCVIVSVLVVVVE